MAKQLVIERLARESVLAQFETFDLDTHGIDEVGLRDATIDWLEGRHGEVVQMEVRILLERVVMSVIKSIIRKSRPTAREIAARFADGQMALPTLDEARREFYRDVDGIAIRLLDMKKEAAMCAGFAYIRLGDENRAKGRRLLRIWQEMEERGLGNESTVRDLYAA